MKFRSIALFTILLFASIGWAQDISKIKGSDHADISIGRPRSLGDGAASNPHPFHVVARHWAPGCEEEKSQFEQTGNVLTGPQGICGEKFLDYWGENLTTSAGETAISQAISNTSAQPASANFIALTNTGITPAVADTSLSGEISSNGFNCAAVRCQATFTDTSAAIGTPPTAGSMATVGTAGAVTVDYWVFACTFQGCTAVGTGVALATSNATLTTSNYNTGSFTGKLGASFYRIIRTHNGTSPTGALAGGACATMTTAGCDGEISAGYVSCGDLVAGTAPTCTFADQANTINAYTVPAADQTFVGKYTLVKTFTATGAQSVQAFGIFNANASGTLYYEGTFASASLVTNDTIQVTETVFH